jgi:hypothetical protein
MLQAIIIDDIYVRDVEKLSAYLMRSIRGK